MWKKSGQWGFSIWEFEVYGRLSKDQNPQLNHAPVFAEMEDQKAVVGEPVSFTLEAADEDGDVLTYEITGEAPEGAAVEAESGKFTWTPQEAGSFEIIFKVSDGTDSGEITVVIEVEEAADVTAPTWPEEGSITIGEAVTASLTIQWPEAEDDTAVKVYEVYLGETLLTTREADERSYTVTGLEPGTEYTFTVIAVDEAGNRSEALTGKGTTEKEKPEPEPEPKPEPKTRSSARSLHPGKGGDGKDRS